MRLHELSAGALLALLLGLPAPAAAYQASTTADGTPLRWWTNCVYWTLIDGSIDNSRFEDPAQSELTFEDLQGAVRGAFSVWDEVDCSYLAFIETDPGHCMDVGLHRDSGNANRVFFRTSGWVDPDSPWRVPEQIALTSVFYDTETGQILDVDIEVNAGSERFQLSTTSEDPRIDIQNALAHEVGHLLGLDHSEVPEATMWTTAPEGELSKRDLSEDDVAGICWDYPVPDDPGHCSEPVGGLDVDCETAESCSPAVDGVAESCWYGEPVCCCEQAGGLGRCSWTSSLQCAELGHHGILELDEATACGGDAPDRFHTCCCHLAEEGAECEWRRFADCEATSGLPSVSVNADFLCGRLPDNQGCGCRVAGPPPIPAVLSALLSALL